MISQNGRQTEDKDENQRIISLHNKAKASTHYRIVLVKVLETIEIIIQVLKLLSYTFS